MIVLTDSDGVAHNFPSVPRRVVSLVPAQTETLYELGLEQNMIGITNKCVYPYHLIPTKVTVGTPNDFQIEKIEALQPDLIIIDDSFTHKNDIAQLKNIAPVWNSRTEHFDDVLKNIEAYGILFNKRTDAQKWLEKLEYSYKNFLRFVAAKPIRKAAYLVSRTPYIAVGNNPFINEVLALNNFENIYAEREFPFSEVEIRKIRIQGDPDIVFLASGMYDFDEEHAFEIGRSTHHAKTVFVDGDFFSANGVRLFKSFEYFRILHERLGDE